MGNISKGQSLWVHLWIKEKGDGILGELPGLQSSQNYFGSQIAIGVSIENIES